MILGITGKAYSGKTTIADYLVKNYGFIKLSFATALKEMIVKAGMCSMEDLTINKNNMSRWIMQKIGTDIFRKQVDKDYWVKKLYENIEYIPKDKNYVIDDVRFKSEANSITERDGKIIKIRCPDSPFNLGENLGDHESEISLELLKCHYVMTVDYGKLDTLYEFMDDYMKLQNISKHER